MWYLQVDRHIHVPRSTYTISLSPMSLLTINKPGCQTVMQQEVVPLVAKSCHFYKFESSSFRVEVGGRTAYVGCG